MVEGPGCKLKGEKIKGKMVGQTVVHVSGNAVDREIKPTKGITTSKFHVLIGCKLVGVQTLGKELFMYFGDLCLRALYGLIVLSRDSMKYPNWRVHFLMAGSFRVNNMKLDHDYGGDAEKPSLELKMSTDTIKFNKSAADVRTTQSCKERYENLHELDICSPVFNQRRAITLFMEQTGRQVCDVLLDQTVLPGVGNIIKNEALFDSGIKPSSKVEELKQEHVSHLIKMTRDFSMIFYKCRKEGTNLNKFMKIYKKRTCGQCEGRIIICRLGDDSERVTYFCSTCQDNNLKNKVKRNLPTKNSLLGWVQSAQETTEVTEWTCAICTLINKGPVLTCAACSTQKPLTDMKDRHTKEDPATLNMKTTGLVGSKRSASSAVGNPELKLKRQKSETKDCSDGANKDKIPKCPGHNQTCALTEVHKKGDNYGKWFFSCAARPRNKQCKFFQWADEGFPICEGHGKPCTLRTVMKTDSSNNGRKFFTCRLPKNKQCRFFLWAVGYD